MDASIRARATRIALLVDLLGNSYTDPIFAEVMESARAAGIDVTCLVCGLIDEDFVPGRRHVAQLATPAEVDGVLLLSLGAGQSAERISAYCERYRPLPMCSIAVPWKDHPHVLIDNEPGMRAGLHHLIEVHGYRRIAFVRGPEASEEAELRYRVYREALASHDIPFDPALVAPGWFIVQSGVDAVRLFLDERKVSFDAVACANDGMAMGVIRELAARNIAVPGRVGVLGFDDADDAHYAEPRLTTVRQPTREQAAEAFNVLLCHIGGNSTVEPKVLETELVIRESCGCSPYWPRDGESRAEVRESAGLGVDELIAATREIRRPATSGRSIERLCRAFLSDMRTGSSSFLRELEAALRSAAAARGDVGSFQKLVTVLDRKVVDRIVVGAEPWRRATAMLHSARVLVSVVAERIPASLKHRYEDFSLKLQRANQATMTATDLASLATVAARSLPEFGISSLFICFYEGDAIPAASHRLVLAWDQQRTLTVPEGGISFPAGTLLPAGYAPVDRWSTFVVFPLERSGPSPGYVAIEYGPKEGFVYELLSQQLASACNRIRMLEQLVEEARRRQAAERERLEKEVRVAQRIQAGLLPRRFAVAGLSLTAALFRSAPVGGDYYDVIPLPDGCFISMGSVSGDGLATGLAMLMLQSVVSGLARSHPEDPPSAILPYVDAVLTENIRRRMSRNERAALTLVRYRADGRLTLAGTRAGFLLCTRGGRTSGRPPSGTWSDSLAPPSRVSPHRDRGMDDHDDAYELSEGDTFVLYTGALPDRGAHFEVLARALERVRDAPAEEIGNALGAQVRDANAGFGTDVALLVAKYEGRPRGAGGSA